MSPWSKTGFPVCRRKLGQRYGYKTGMVVLFTFVQIFVTGFLFVGGCALLISGLAHH